MPFIYKEARALYEDWMKKRIEYREEKDENKLFIVENEYYNLTLSYLADLKIFEKLDLNENLLSMIKTQIFNAERQVRRIERIRGYRK